MEEEHSGTPAWLVCVDLLSKIKTEMITQAMETLQQAIDSKAIEIEGSLVTTPDQHSESEMQIFIIRRLIEQREGIINRYKGYLSASGEKQTPEMMQQTERLKKFLLSVDQIAMLMHYSEISEHWMNELAMQVGAASPRDAIKRTLNEERSELLRYLLNNRKIKSEKMLTNAETKILEGSLRAD